MAQTYFMLSQAQNSDGGFLELGIGLLIGCVALAYVVYKDTK